MININTAKHRGDWFTSPIDPDLERMDEKEEVKKKKKGVKKNKVKKLKRQTEGKVLWD